jgi:hypothetical protein
MRAWAAGHWVAYSKVDRYQEGGKPGTTHEGPKPARWVAASSPRPPACWGALQRMSRAQALGTRRAEPPGARRMRRRALTLPRCPGRCWGKQMDAGGHLFNTRYSGNFEEPNMHDEVFDMVADLNKKLLQVGLLGLWVRRWQGRRRAPRCARAGLRCCCAVLVRAAVQAGVGLRPPPGVCRLGCVPAPLALS